jgi:molecular chaperone HscB
LAQLGQLIDEKRDYPAAAAQVRVLMFLDKFQRDLRVRQQALAQGSAVQ